MAAAILKAGEVKEDHHHVRRAFAKQWWADELRLHDFLPNENAIRFKGSDHSGQLSTSNAITRWPWHSRVWQRFLTNAS
jgi:hypothetical protein